MSTCSLRKVISASAEFFFSFKQRIFRRSIHAGAASKNGLILERYLFLASYFLIKHVDKISTKRRAYQLFRALRLHAVISLLAPPKTHKTKWNQFIAHDSHARQDRTGVRLHGKEKLENSQLISLIYGAIEMLFLNGVTWTACGRRELCRKNGKRQIIRSYFLSSEVV